MSTDNVLFIGLVVAWLALRIGTRAWLRPRVESGAISPQGALLVQAATFAVIPLLAIPWRNSPTEIALLVGLSVVLFLAQLAFMRFLLWFMRRR